MSVWFLTISFEGGFSRGIYGTRDVIGAAFDEICAALESTAHVLIKIDGFSNEARRTEECLAFNTSIVLMCVKGEV